MACPWKQKPESGSLVNMENRKQKILDILETCDEITIKELSDRLDVSLVTIRKDVSKLEAKGMVVRKHGSVAKATTTHNIFQQFLPYRLRKITKVEEKTKIAAKVMDYIEPEDTIFLDAGSSALAVANELLEKEHISIVTNSICAANLLNDSNHSVYLAGGTVLSRGMCTIGSEAESFIRKFYCKKAIISTTGIRKDLSLTVTLDTEAGVKKAIIESAVTVILLATDDKFYNSSLFEFCDASQIDIIITNYPSPPPHILRIIEEYDILLVYAD